MTFASPSAVRGFLEQFAPGEGLELLGRTAIAVIGPVTAAAIERLGLRVAVCPPEATAEALVESLAGYLANARNA